MADIRKPLERHLAWHTSKADQWIAEATDMIERCPARYGLAIAGMVEELAERDDKISRLTLLLVLIGDYAVRSRMPPLYEARMEDDGKPQ